MTVTNLSAVRSYIDDRVDEFADATASFEKELDTAITNLGEGDTSDPKALAAYQKALMKYTLHMNAESSFIKGIKDMDNSMLHNFN